ncbi:MAG: hypothetical protein AB7N76_10990 [Planctomycetota bacterium]
MAEREAPSGSKRRCAASLLLLGVLVGGVLVVWWRRPVAPPSPRLLPELLYDPARVDSSLLVIRGRRVPGGGGSKYTRGGGGLRAPAARPFDFVLSPLTVPVWVATLPVSLAADLVTLPYDLTQDGTHEGRWERFLGATRAARPNEDEEAAPRESAEPRGT